MRKQNPIPEKDDTSKGNETIHLGLPPTNMASVCGGCGSQISSEGTHAHAQAKPHTRKGRHQQRKRNHTPGPSSQHGICGGGYGSQISSEGTHAHAQAKPNTRKGRHQQRKRNHTPGPFSQGTHAHAQAKPNTRKGRHQQRKRNHTPGPSSHQHGICVWWVRKPNLL